MTDDPMAATEQFMTVVDKTMQEKKVAPRFAKKVRRGRVRLRARAHAARALVSAAPRVHVV